MQLLSISGPSTSSPWMRAPSLAAKGGARSTTRRTKPLVLVLCVLRLLSTAGACTPTAINEDRRSVGIANSIARNVQSAFVPDTGFHVSCEKAACAIAALLVALSQMMAAGAASFDVTYWFTPSTTHSYAGMRDEYVCLARCRKVGKRRCQDLPAG